MVQTTPGTDGSAGYNYIAKDDDVWLYTGVTSATGDESIVGFVLVNQRTAEAHFYSCAGATESSAMQSAEGQVQNLRYEATFPILINVNNTPTYFMALKDNAGLVKKYAMVDIQSYQNVAGWRYGGRHAEVVPVAHCGKRNSGEYVVGKRFGT